jgi:GNAT superfamily N-acetyltransferase/predicted esterase
MREMTYTQLINQTLSLYSQGDFESAYDLITEKGPEIGGIPAQIYNFRYALACKLGNKDLALDIMKEAIVDKGYWYAYSYLLEDDDLESLRGDVLFESLVETCRERELFARLEAKPELVIKKGEGSKWLVALHGNQENARVAEPYWSVCMNHGYSLALPQSDQIEFSDAYCWDDLEKSTAALKKHCEKLLLDDPESKDNLVLAGFSAGARTVLGAILSGEIKAKAFILVGAWLPEVDEWLSLLDLLNDQEVKGYIYCGEDDSDALEGTLKLVSYLKQKQFPHIFEQIKGLDHDFPVDWQMILEKVLKLMNDADSTIKTNEIVIDRPKPKDEEASNDFFKSILTYTFESNGIDGMAEDLELEIKTKIKYLKQDIDSDGEKRHFLIAKMADNIVGTIEFGPANELITACNDAYLSSLPEIGSVFVDPKYHNLGIASKMLDAIYAILKQRGFDTFCLDSGYGNAQKVWTHKFGAPKITLKDHWGEGLDHMIWQVAIDSVS